MELSRTRVSFNSLHRRILVVHELCTFTPAAAQRFSDGGFATRHGIRETLSTYSYPPKLHTSMLSSKHHMHCSSWLLEILHRSKVESNRQRNCSRASCRNVQSVERPGMLRCFAPAADIPNTLYRIIQFRIENIRSCRSVLHSSFVTVRDSLMTEDMSTDHAWKCFALSIRYPTCSREFLHFEAA
jgi:hypothetical protein